MVQNGFQPNQEQFEDCSRSCRLWIRHIVRMSLGVLVIQSLSQCLSEENKYVVMDRPTDLKSYCIQCIFAISLII